MQFETANQTKHHLRYEIMDIKVICCFNLKTMVKNKKINYNIESFYILYPTSR